MCVSQEMENHYGFCFDKLRMDMGQGWDETIQGFLFRFNIGVTDEAAFGRAFLDFLEKMNDEKLIEAI